MNKGLMNKPLIDLTADLCEIYNLDYYAAASVNAMVINIPANAVNESIVIESEAAPVITNGLEKG